MSESISAKIQRMNPLPSPELARKIYEHMKRQRDANIEEAVAQARLNKALKDKHLLLNHENETFRKAVDEIHQKYLSMTPKQKRDRYVHGVTI